MQQNTSATANPPQTPYPGKTPFDEFQLEEYRNISNAHFESIQQISIFFRYYLLVLAAPALILGILPDKENGFQSFLEGKSLPIYYNIICAYFIVVSFIGFALFIYVVNLRFDVVLYARTVNKVRKFFYEKSDLPISQHHLYKQLPTVSTLPRYSETTFVLPLFCVFLLTNCSFIFIAFNLKLLSSPFFGTWPLPFAFPLSEVSIWLLLALYVVAHITVYRKLIAWRNNYYLKSYAIGIDIDGVINEQTTHFIHWLNTLTGKNIKKEDIQEIPVSLNSNLKDAITGKPIVVTSEDERIVFNTREYWESLPVKANAIKRLDDFHKVFGYKILIFSYRDWPQYSNDSEKQKIIQLIKSKGFTPLLKKSEILAITKEWLKNQNLKPYIISGFWSALFYRCFSYIINKKRTTIEIGNPYISDTRFWRHLRRQLLTNNRFQGANLESLRFFVEDTPENALKLSNLCEYVFLIDQPYNSESMYSFPKNVIRVKGWDDIYRHMKLIS